MSAFTIFSGCVSLAPATTSCADATTKKITINYKRNNEIKVSPATRQIKPGEAIRYVFKGNVPRNVEIDGETVTDDWLNTTGVGSPRGNSYYVCVDNAQAETDYRYMIKVDQVGSLDPVVRVKK